MRCLILALAIPMLALVAACSSMQADLTVPLTFRPERQSPGQHRDLRPSPSLKLYIAPIADDRPDKTRIGENIELSNKPPRPVYASGPAPVDFVGSVVSREFASAGLIMVSEASQANRILALRLTEFFTSESSQYRTDVRAAAEVRDTSGHVLWSGQSAGSSERFGRSLSPWNYNEGFSDASLELVGGLLNDQGFRKAVATD